MIKIQKTTVKVKQPRSKRKSVITRGQLIIKYLTELNKEANNDDNTIQISLSTLSENMMNRYQTEYPKISFQESAIRETLEYLEEDTKQIFVKNTRGGNQITVLNTNEIEQHEIKQQINTIPPFEIIEQISKMNKNELKLLSLWINEKISG